MGAVEIDHLTDTIALVTLNRPDRLNAIDGELIEAMDRVLDVLASGAYRAAVLTGAGRGFCAGADLSGTGAPWVAPAGSDLKTVYDSQVRLADLYTRLYELPIPVVAAVNGAAVGGGLAFALHCDVRVASTTARFGSVFIMVGFSSLDMGTSYLLPRIVGAGVARELMLTGRIIGADEAARIHLVHDVVAPEALIHSAQAVAELIAANNPFGVWQTKVGLNAALDATSLRHPMELENRTQVLATFTGNPREAAAALMAKRAPVWGEL
jgi:enoyl-CoA hydratase/carnithine racemase